MIDRLNRPESHRHRRKLPEIGHQPRMRIRRKPPAGFQLAAEVLQLLPGYAAFKVGAGINARCGVSLEIDDIAVARFSGRLKKVIKCHFVERGRRRKRRNVSADAFLKLVGADDHGHGIPPHQALDAPLHFLAAWKRRLLPRRNRVLVGSRRRKRQVDPRLAPGMKRQLLQKPPRPLRSAARQHIIERVQPLPRLQDFNSVRRLRLTSVRNLFFQRLSHDAPTKKCVSSS